MLSIVRAAIAPAAGSDALSTVEYTNATHVNREVVVVLVVVGEREDEATPLAANLTGFRALLIPHGFRLGARAARSRESCSRRPLPRWPCNDVATSAQRVRIPPAARTPAACVLSLDAPAR